MNITPEEGNPLTAPNEIGHWQIRASWLLAFSLALLIGGLGLIPPRVPPPPRVPTPPKQGSVTEPTSPRLPWLREREKHLEEMQQATTTLNHPSLMYVGQRTQVTLVVAPNERAASATLDQKSERNRDDSAQTATTEVAPQMLARLHGLAFKVEAGSPEYRSFSNQPIEWTWYVEPLAAGPARLLRLELFAVAWSDVNGPLPAKELKALEARVDVRITLWTKLLMRAREMQPVAIVLSSFGVLGTVVALYSKMTFWLRRRRAKKVRALRITSIRELNEPFPGPPSDWTGHRPAP
jgi:hypothetical protein